MEKDVAVTSIGIKGAGVTKNNASVQIAKLCTYRGTIVTNEI